MPVTDMTNIGIPCRTSPAAGRRF